MRYAVTAFVASLATAVVLVFTEAHGSASSLRVINLVDKARHGTWSCQVRLGRPRTRSVYSERHTRSVPYRRWVLRLWQRRSGRCQEALRRARAAAAAAPSVDYGKWLPIFRCESAGLGWGVNTGNGYEGGLQITPSNWTAYGGLRYAPRAYLASPSAQIAIAERILADQGWNAWPTCSRLAGYR